MQESIEHKSYISQVYREVACKKIAWFKERASIAPIAYRASNELVSLLSGTLLLLHESSSPSFKSIDKAAIVPLPSFDAMIVQVRAYHILVKTIRTLVF